MIWHCITQTLIFYPPTEYVHNGGEGGEITFSSYFFLSQESVLIVMVDTTPMSCLVALFLVILIIFQLLMQVIY